MIDNFSRRILAWNVSGPFEPAITAQLLRDAADATATSKPTVLVDGGVENLNFAVDDVVASGILKRVLAQTEISFPNSLIESWWRILKHQWLYLSILDTVATIEKLVTFYVDQHNVYMPHSAYQGQAPDELKTPRLPLVSPDRNRTELRLFRRVKNKSTSLASRFEETGPRVVQFEKWRPHTCAIASEMRRYRDGSRHAALCVNEIGGSGPFREN